MDSYNDHHSLVNLAKAEKKSIQRKSTSKQDVSIKAQSLIVSWAFECNEDSAVSRLSGVFLFLFLTD